MNDDVQKYIDRQGSLQREILLQLRQLIMKTAPLAQESMSYGVPAFKVQNGTVIMYAAFKNHVGIYPEPEVIRIFVKELAEYKTAKGSITFPLDKPIPYVLIRKIVAYKYKKLLKANMSARVQKTKVASGVVHKVPKYLKDILIGQPDVLALWNALTPLARNEWICYVISVKQAQTRAKHLIRLQEDLRRGKKRPCCWAGCPHRSS